VQEEEEKEAASGTSPQCNSNELQYLAHHSSRENRIKINVIEMERIQASRSRRRKKSARQPQ
jgi:hypothetical protein